MPHLDPDDPRRSRTRFSLRSTLRDSRPTVERLEDRQLMSADLVGASSPLSPTPVAGMSLTGIVARFTDATKNTDPTLYAASIQWGDGGSSQGTVATDPTGGFDVIGTHTFAQAGSDRITAQVGATNGDSVSVSTTNLVADPAIASFGVAVHPGRNGAISRATVAAFVDNDASLGASAFSATIHWGDGQTSAGSIVAVKSIHGFKVVGSHKYAKSGSYSVSTTIEQGPASAVASFTSTNLISDGAVVADHVNPSFVNPWGLVAPKPDDFWSGNNGTGTSTVFDSAGNLSPGLPIVTIPAPSGDPNPSAPTGVVSNKTQGFVVSDGTASGPASFLWATEDGTIAGWNFKVATTGGVIPSTHAVLAVDHSASGAVYKGLALLNVPAGGTLATGDYLFATNFRSGNLDVFDSSFKPVTLPAGAFADSTIPAGFAPFGVQAIDGDLYVAYAKQDNAKHDDVAGPGNGYVDVYSTAGALLRRLGGTAAQPELNSPWGLAVAPANFGGLGNDILVGNFGDSHVSAFDPTTGAFLGQLVDASGNPIVLDGGFQGPDSKGLWGIFAFAGGTGASADTLYFTSGFNDEGDGVFGALTPTQVATTTATTGATVGRLTHR